MTIRLHPFETLPFTTDFGWQLHRRQAFAPAVDILEKPEAFFLRMELPGVDKEHVKVQIENGVLTVSGERSRAELQDGAQYLLRELRDGKFERQFKVGAAIDTSAIAANFQNGILEIVLPKAEKAVSQEIKIA